MEAGTLLREVAGGRLPGLILLHGPEPLLVEEVLGRLSAALLGAEAVNWNREMLHADGLDPDTLVAAGLALPLLAGRRLVVVRGLTEAPARGVERLLAQVSAATARPGGWPDRGTTVVLLAPGLARRSPLLRLVSADRQVEVRPPAGRAVLAWLGQRARAEGFELTPGAAQILLELVGEDLARLASEIAKAAAFVDAGGRLAEEGVRQLVGEGRVRQYWELTQALEGGDRPGALRVLEDLLERGEDPVVLLAQITGHVRDVWRIRAGVSAHLPPRRLGELLPRRRPEWAVERLRARAEGWSAATIQGAVRRCFEVELRIKSGGGDPRALLTALVADLAAA